MPLKESMPSRLEPTTFALSSWTVRAHKRFSIVGAASANGSNVAAVIKVRILALQGSSRLEI